MNRCPVALFHATAQLWRPRNVIGNIGERIGFTGLDNAIEGLAQTPAALAVIGKEIEQIPADHFVTAAHDDLFVSLIDGDVTVIPVKHHVRTGQDIEQLAEVYRAFASFILHQQGFLPPNSALSFQTRQRQKGSMFGDIFFAYLFKGL
jgi:hypothetical protein